MFSYARTLILYSILAILTTALISSCGHGENREQLDKVLVINELMATNRTGLMTANGKHADWIEIKNVSATEIRLSDYTLEYREADTLTADSLHTVSTQENKTAETERKFKQCGLPDTVLLPGKTFVVFATKGDKNKPTGNRADFKLSGNGGTVRIMSGHNNVMAEVAYDALSADQSLSRTARGTMAKTYFPTPSFENDAAGYEAYSKLIDSQRTSPLRIWEMMTRVGRNSHAWVELKNISDSVVELSHYSLTTKMKKAKRWTLPSQSLQPGGTIVIEFAGRQADDKTPRWANFKLKNNESVILLKDGKFADGLCAKATKAATSIGRTEGKAGFFFFDQPSRGVANAKPYRHIATEPEFTPAPGIYNKVKKLTITLLSHGQKIHYTTDGTMPTPQSPLFKDSITITQTTTIRAYAEGDTCTLTSPITTATYFVNENHTVAVVNVTIPAAYLFDPQTGIYMRGPNPGSEYPYKTANYWKPIDRPAHIEYYDDKGSFSTDCAFAIFGGFSRTREKKSFKVKFRSEFGTSHISYDFFNQGHPVELKNFILRSGSQDDCGTMVRDEFFTDLMAHQSPTLLTQAYRPVALYINAKYFGLYFIREKIDKHYVARHLRVSPDSITILMSRCYTEEGNATDYRDLMAYIKNHDMAQKEHYDAVAKRMDFQSLIDQKLGQIYASNIDAGNIRFVRSEDKRSDKKWYWIYYDLDLSWAQNKPSSYYLAPSNDTSNGSVTFHNIMIYRLLQNADFRRLFMQRLSWHMHHTFTPQYATAQFDRIINLIKPEMKRNCQRWPQLKYATWEKNVAEFRSKFKSKYKFVYDDLNNFLKFTPEEKKTHFSDLKFQ